MSKQYSLRELINPTERQLEFFKQADSHTYTLYGGAKGGGKSYILRWAVLRQLLKYAQRGFKGVRGVIFCEDYPALTDRQISKIKVEFPQWLGTLGASQTDGLGFRIDKKFGGGFIALRNLDDPSKYASSEFAVVAIDEVTKNEKEKFDQLRSIRRWPGIEDTKWFGGTNPGDIGHAWVKALFVDRIFGPEDPLPEQVAFVKSLPTDNPHNAKAYLEELARLPEKLRKAYYEGNWDVFEGQFFTEWDKNIHVVSPFPIPQTWKRFRSYDYGYENPACCKWYAIDWDGRVWVYREKYWKKGHRTDAETQAKEIARLSEGELYDYSVADPAIFSPTGVVDKFGGQTIAESLIRHGFNVMPASNRRVDGWSLMHQYLRWQENVTPRMLYFSNCEDSIRTIPTLVHDEIKPEDLDTDGEDHAADVDRYFLTSLHERPGMRAKTDVETKMEQFNRKHEMHADNLNELYYG